mmetsp:Transcript_24013/g.43048  ORF Transcript_24013/g.43048 Transcript_24013/m.43048 type:complete len:777 (+) Transcript_24013:174-2504(+)
MSDSSDAESSDDDLLASPVFKKRDRRTERAEKNKLDFFDTCLKGSDARTDIHRRIASVENEFIKKENKEEADGQEEGEGSIMDEAKTNTGNSETAGDGKEHVQNNNATIKTEQPPAVTVKSEENNEDAYWKKMDSFAEQIAQKTPGAIHSARRKLTDAVSGLDYTSDLTDDEGGKWKDGVSGMTREQMRSEAEAKSQGLSSNLGVRKMFRRPATAVVVDTKTEAAQRRKHGVSGEGEVNAFDSRKGAFHELKSIVSSLQKSHRIPKTQLEKTLRKQFIDPLVKIMKKPQDCIWDCMGYFLRMNPVMSGKYAILLPEPFCKWMWKMACSSFQVGQQCSTDCFHLVRKFLVKELDVHKDVPSFGVDMAFLKNFCMDDLVSCLENDFGLWLEHGPVVLTTAENGGDNSDAVEISKEKDSRTVDVYALKNIFLIWMALFHRNLIQIRGTNDEDSSAFGEDASKALVAFTRVGLDPHFCSANDCSNTCGEPLHAMIQMLTLSLVRSTTSQINKQFDESHVEKWMKQAAGCIVDACSDLSAGDKNAADSDDVNGHLPLAMAVKGMCSCELNNDFSMEIALMKLNFAEQALHKCLKEITDWEDKVRERTDFLCKDWGKDNASGSPVRERLQHGMHALVTAEVGFLWIEEESESFMDNHPHLLAAVLIAGECALVGACIFWCSYGNDSQSEEPVYTTEEKDAVYESMSNIEDLCGGLKKECRAVIAYPHLRRTKEYLTRFSKKLGGIKGKSSKDKSKKRREQGSLDSYFSRPSMSDAFRETQDS